MATLVQQRSMAPSIHEQTFGRVSSQVNTPRVAQLKVRVEF